MALDATVSGANSNSYVIVADADTYFAERLNASAWTAADSATKEAALIQATRRIDLEEFAGRKTVSTQALKWPRTNVWTEEGQLISSTVIWANLKQATYAVALLLLNEDVDANRDAGLYQSIKLGSLEAVFRTHRITLWDGPLPREVARLFQGNLISTGQARLLRS